MIKEIQKLNTLIFEPSNLILTEPNADLECEDYLGYNFKINEIKIKFRKSKLTPKKTGQFVTVWKRNPEGETIPFDINDDFNFYIIAIEENNNSGFFIFPKSVLERQKILSNKANNGKRGFRIYADWNIVESPQAKKTKLWQTQFFINFSKREIDILEKFENILNLAK